MTIREVVQQYYDCANRGAWDECLALISDDVVFDDQLAGHFAGIDVLRKAIDANVGGKAVFLASPQHTLVDGDAACVIWRYLHADHPRQRPIREPGATLISPLPRVNAAP